MLEAYLPLARQLARKLHAKMPKCIPIEDIDADALLGLFQAAQRYDKSRGVPFPAFARRRIQGAILDGLRDADWATRALRASGRAPDRPIAFSEVGAQRLSEALCCHPAWALDDRDELNHHFSRLTRRQRLALQLHLLEGVNLRQTGEVLGMTEAGASLLLRRTVARIKQPRGRRGPRGRHFSPHSSDHR